MIYLLLADGFEEIEALATTDILRRAGLETLLVSIHEDRDGLWVTGAHGITVKADEKLSQIDEASVTALILPGGMPGTLNLSKSEAVNQLILACYKDEILIAAICAAPAILGDLGLLDGKKATCYPGFESRLKGALIKDDKIVKDGQIITGKGAGTACEFAFKIVKTLDSKDKAAAIKMGMMFD